MSFSQQIMTYSSLSPIRRLRNSQLQQKKQYLQVDWSHAKFSSFENMGCCKRSFHIGSYSAVTFQLCEKINGNVTALSSNSSSSSSSNGKRSSRNKGDPIFLRSTYEKDFGMFQFPSGHFSNNHSRYSRNRSHNNTHSRINFAIRQSSSLSKNSSDEYETVARLEPEVTQLNRHDTKNNDNESKIEKDGHKHDRYYYLIKQKYSPSRHQKYRSNSTDGLLEKTVSNKPLKDRIVQSYADVVAYFMPKGDFKSLDTQYTELN